MAIWSPGPSFSRSIARASRDRQFAASRIMLSKPGNRRLLQALDAPVPERFRRIGALDELTPDDLAEPTVVKPAEGSNNRGVLPLLPIRPGVWRDVEHNVDLRFDRIREELARALVQHSLADEWIAEELLRGPDDGPIDDVKFMMFHGYMGAAYVRRNSTHTFTWFDEHWKPTSSGIRLHRSDPTVPPPDDRERLQALATRISAALPIPFVRVDLYSTARGPVAGELTPFPGWAHDMDQAIDTRLGELYEAAESRLIRDGMDWGRLVDRDEVREMIERAEPARPTRTGALG